MSQASVLEFLEKNKNKWFEAKKIGEGINLGTSRICNNLRKLRKYNLILSEHRQLVKTTQRRWFYKYKGY